MNKKIAFKTLGCRLNQFETDAIAAQFKQNGYEVVENETDADAVVVNSCTVTNQSDKKSRYAISQSLRKAKDPVLLVTGCMATHYKDKLKEQHNIAYVVDNEHKTSVFQILDSHFKGEVVDPELFKPDVFGFQTAHESFHTRSFIKIQDGCDNFCTYCIVPAVRGRAVSRPVDDILQNIREVLADGYKEIVLTGVNITRYDYQGIFFTELVEKILNMEGDFRLRISSIEPEGFGDKFLDLLSHPKMTPHLHVCLQSGSDRILLQMRRFYTLNTFREIISKIRSRIPDFNFTTDIIAGFPGETDEDHTQTLESIREFNFTHVHTFKYSKRDHTRAARMSMQVNEKLKNERSEEVRLLAEQLKAEYRKTFVGRKQRLLIERIENGIARGYGEHYIPIELPIGDTHIARNSFVDVVLKGFVEGHEDMAMSAEYA